MDLIFIIEESEIEQGFFSNKTKFRPIIFHYHETRCDSLSTL